MANWTSELIWFTVVTLPTYNPLLIVVVCVIVLVLTSLLTSMATKAMMYTVTRVLRWILFKLFEGLRVIAPYSFCMFFAVTITMFVAPFSPWRDCHA